MMFYAQLTLGLLLLFIGAFVMTMNWAVIAQWLLRRKHSSWVPLLGGLLVSASLVVLPVSGVRYLWWLPLLLDWGCIPGMTWTVISLGVRMRN